MPRFIRARCGSRWQDSIAVLGHMFPVWLGFHGGKGVATATGVFLALDPIVVRGVRSCLRDRADRIAHSCRSRRSSAAASIPILFRFLAHDAPFWRIDLLICIAIAVILKHHSNIARLARDGTSSGGKGRRGTDEDLRDRSGLVWHGHGRRGGALRQRSDVVGARSARRATPSATPHESRYLAGIALGEKCMSRTISRRRRRLRHALHGHAEPSLSRRADANSRHLRAPVTMISGTKGIENESQERMSEISRTFSAAPGSLCGVVGSDVRARDRAWRSDGRGDRVARRRVRADDSARVVEHQRFACITRTTWSASSLPAR